MSILMLAAIYRGGKIVQCSDFTKSSVEMQNHIQAKHIDKTTEETRSGEEGLLAKPNKVARPALFYFHQEFQYLT